MGGGVKRLNGKVTIFFIGCLYVVRVLCTVGCTSKLRLQSNMYPLAGGFTVQESSSIEGVINPEHAPVTVKCRTISNFQLSTNTVKYRKVDQDIMTINQRINKSTNH